LKTRSKIVYIKIFSAILFCFIFQTVFSQEQSNFLDSVSEKFLKYCEIYPREELYVHTDREEYIAGEKIRFEMYLFDRQSASLSSNSSVAYFEILNSENRPVVQKRIHLEQGTGPGTADLPDTLSSGNYILRAYTNRMKNFMPDNCFSKKIDIYNALSSGGFKSMANRTIALIKPDATEKNDSARLTGFSLEVNNLKSDSVEIIISSDSIFRSLNKNLCYLFIQTRGIINYKDKISLSFEKTRISIPGAVLIPGINHLTMFGSDGKPLAERFIYTPPADDGHLTLASSDSFGVRAKILIRIPLKNDTSSLNHSNISVSVVSSTEKTCMNIADYMIFGSEFGVLPDDIVEPGSGKISSERMANFLLNAKSNWIDWNTILSGNYPALEYNYEQDYHYIDGHLFNRSLQTPDSGQILFLSIPGKNAFFQYSVTKPDGSFRFSIPVDEKIKDLIIQPEEINPDNSIKIRSSFSEKYPVAVSSGDLIKEAPPRYISRWKVNYQVNKIYETADALANISSIAFRAPKRFYGKPDIELNMKDYIELPVMQEVFYELLPGVIMKQKKSEYEIQIADPVYNIVYDKPPVLFIDGVVVHEPSVIVGLNPDRVEKIDVIKDRYVVGDYLFCGLVNVITKAGDYSDVNLPGYAVRVSYRAIEPVNAFLSPDYSTEERMQSRIPDFRNTLYWNPSVQWNTDGNYMVEFWSSDLTGDYEINIQGITDKGKTVLFRKIITITR
jgi:hypothetical protein